MTIRRIIFERGLATGSYFGDIPLTNRSESVGAICKRISDRWNVRPVLLMQGVDNWHSKNVPPPEPFPIVLLSTGDGDVANFKTQWTNVIIKSPSLLHFARNLEYVLDLMLYHVSQIAVRYVQVTADAARNAGIPGSSYGEVVHYAGREECYYEFDAILAAVRRAFEMAAYVIWTRCGSPHSRPRNFEGTMKASTRLPPHLRQELQLAWDQWGRPVSDYRDCIMHNCPLEFGHGTAEMQRIGEYWKVSVFIPDNPQAKSKKNFTFGMRIDALTFAWEAATSTLVAMDRLREWIEKDS